MKTYGLARVTTRLLSALPLALVLTPCLVQQASAWGDNGHQIICQIAYLELKPQIKARVDALTAIDPKFRTSPTAAPGLTSFRASARRNIISMSAEPIMLSIPPTFVPLPTAASHPPF